ncbi:hypothetical protein [Duganella sp. HH105]|uniref:hypothetical protein n=1 Tax=Duganella sp. HH105 TaxID=1781067 RepID=UPI00114C9B6F|nr:hypothetical protein [Duganella sp. HH105]
MSNHKNNPVKNISRTILFSRDAPITQVTVSTKIVIANINPSSLIDVFLFKNFFLYSFNRMNCQRRLLAAEPTLTATKDEDDPKKNAAADTAAPANTTISAMGTRTKARPAKTIPATNNTNAAA